MALIDGLRTQGAKIVVTTHLQMLKAYGVIHPDVVNVSVEFNPETLRPNYRLIYGQPGESYALPMAEKWGLPLELIQRAKAYLGEGDRQVGELLQHLEKIRDATEAKLEEYGRLREEAEIARKNAEALLLQTRQEEERILIKAQEEAQTQVRQAKEDLRGLINEFKAKGRTDVHRLAQAIRAEEEKIAGFPRSAYAQGLSGCGSEEGFQNKEISSGRSSLERLQEALAQKSQKKNKLRGGTSSGSIHYEIPPATPSIKVIGLRVEEALPRVDRAIDDAFLQGLREVEIIHGAGTGRLRQAIREHLEEHAFVKSFLPGEGHRGGDGITLVEIGLASTTSSSSQRSGKTGWRRK
jgi:DNA mismatch repair protein MutS2